MKSSSRGFSLVELLAALAIIAIIATFAMPAVNTVFRGSQLTQAAQMVTSQLDLARQSALSSNLGVEIRFYQFGDPQTPGEQASSPATGHYRAMQAFQIEQSGTAVPLGKVQLLPTSIIIDAGVRPAGQTLSSIVSSATAPASSNGPVLTSGDVLGSPIPRVGMQYNCVAFRFLPDGSTNLSALSPPGPWFFTLHSINDGDARSTPPPNYYTVQIDPTNGHIKNFQP